MKSALPRLALLFLATTGFAVAADQRTNTNSLQSLAINGTTCPEVLAWSGGEASAPVILEPSVNGASPKKHLGAVRCEPIVVETALPLSPALLECVADLLANRATPRTLLLNTASAISGENTTVQANNAVLIEARFPALDGSSKDALRVTLVFQADSTTPTKPLPIVEADVAAKAPKAKAALVSNFRLTLAGLPTGRVARIEAFTVRRPTADTTVGQPRSYAGALPATVIPDLALQIGAADLAEWGAWRDSFLIKGDNTDSAEKAGALEILAPDLKTALFTLKLGNVGLLRLTAPIGEPEKIKRLHADLYCETMSVVAIPTKASAKTAKGQE